MERSLAARWRVCSRLRPFSGNVIYVCESLYFVRVGVRVCSFIGDGFHTGGRQEDHLHFP